MANAGTAIVGGKSRYEPVLKGDYQEPKVYRREIINHGRVLGSLAALSPEERRALLSDPQVPNHPSANADAHNHGEISQENVPDWSTKNSRGNKSMTPPPPPPERPSLRKPESNVDLVLLALKNADAQGMPLNVMEGFTGLSREKIIKAVSYIKKNHPAFTVENHRSGAGEPIYRLAKREPGDKDRDSRFSLLTRVEHFFRSIRSGDGKWIDGTLVAEALDAPSSSMVARIARALEKHLVSLEHPMRLESRGKGKELRQYRLVKTGRS